MQYRDHAHPPAARRRLSRRSGRVIAVGLLLSALVLLQSLGLIHRTAHRTQVPAGITSTSLTTPSAGPHADAGWLKALFTGHAEGAACVLYDQLAHADVLFDVPTPHLPDTPVMRAGTVHRAWHLAYQAAGFLARGPPIAV